MIYTLYLNTNTGTKLPNPNRFANTQWRVNWDELFNHKNYQYSKCTVKIELTNTIDIIDLNQANTWKDYNGYITCNLQSTNQYSAKGLNSVEYNLGGAILALFRPDPNMVYIPYDNSGNATNFVWNNQFRVNTLDSDGVECITPTGEQFFNLTFWTGGYSVNQPAYSYYDLPYFVRLVFELRK